MTTRVVDSSTTSTSVSPSWMRSPAASGTGTVMRDAVQGRAVARAEVDEPDRAPVEDALDPRVHARERAVPERHVVRRGTAQRQDRAVEQDSARRLSRHPHVEDEHEAKSSNNNRFGAFSKRPARVILRGSGVAHHAAKP